MTRRPFTAVLALGVLLTLGAAPARATFTRANFTGAQAALAGDGFVYAEGGALFSVAGGPVGTQLFALPQQRGMVALDASATRVGLVSGGVAYSSPLRAGAPLRIGPVAATAISVSGDVLAYTVAEGGAGTAVAGAFRAPTARAGPPPQVAGPYVAVATPAGALAVYERESEAEIYRVPIGARDEFSLGEDGTVVVFTGMSARACSARGAWASIAAPTLHPLGLGQVCTAGRYAAGRVAVVRKIGGRMAELAVIDFGGAVRRVTTQPAMARSPGGGLFLDDMSPTRLLWGQRRCDHRTLTVQDGLDAFAAVPPPPVACPISLPGSSRLRVSEAGKVTVPVRCPRNCTDVNVRIRAGGAVVARRLLGLVFHRGAAMPVALQLARTARDAVARGGRVFAEVTAATENVDGSPRAATKTVTLVR